MQIAIKYCGGCNCTYQRGTAVKKLKALFTEHNYVVGMRTGYMISGW